MANTHRHILMASTTSSAASPSGSTSLPDKDAPTDMSTPGTPFSARKRGKKGKGTRKGRHPSHVADVEGNVIKLSKPMYGLDNPDEISKDSKVEKYTEDDPPKRPPRRMQLRSQGVQVGGWDTRVKVKDDKAVGVWVKEDVHPLTTQPIYLTQDE